jgi:hypothetical protein
LKIGRNSRDIDLQAASTVIPCLSLERTCVTEHHKDKLYLQRERERKKEKERRGGGEEINGMDFLRVTIELPVLQ